jgi:hypothetical protein
MTERKNSGQSEDWLVKNNWAALAISMRGSDSTIPSLLLLLHGLARTFVREFLFCWARCRPA